MWIKTQTGNATINSDLFYGIFLSDLTEEVSIFMDAGKDSGEYNFLKLGSYKNFDRAKKVFENIFDAMADGQKVFTMPEDLDEEIFKEKAN